MNSFINGVSQRKVQINEVKEKKEVQDVRLFINCGENGWLASIIAGNNQWGTKIAHLRQ